MSMEGRRGGAGTGQPWKDPGVRRGAHGRTCGTGGQDVCERIPCTQAQGAHPRGGPEDRGCGPGRVGVTGRAGSPPPPGVVLQSRGAWACAHGCAAAPVVLLRGRVGRAGVSLGDADPGLQERGHLRSTDQPLGWHRVPQCGDVRPDARERRVWPAARPAPCPGPRGAHGLGGPPPPAVSLGPCARVTVGSSEVASHICTERLLRGAPGTVRPGPYLEAGVADLRGVPLADGAPGGCGGLRGLPCPPHLTNFAKAKQRQKGKAFFVLSLG